MYCLLKKCAQNKNYQQFVRTLSMHLVVFRNLTMHTCKQEACTAGKAAHVTDVAP